MHLTRKPLFAFVPALAISLLGPAGPAASTDLAGAEEPVLAEPFVAPSPWTFTFTSYNWIPWITGDAVVRGRRLDIDASAGEIIDHLDWDPIPAWMSYIEARRGALTLFNDVVYAKLSDSGDFATSRGSGSALGGQLRVDYEQVIVEFGGAYEVAAWQSGLVPFAAGPTALDVVAGGRYWHQDLDVSGDLSATIDLDGLNFSGNRAIARSGSVDWVDPFVGLRLRYQPAFGQEVVLRGDVGGFGAGSDFSWQVIGTYQWQACTLWGMDYDGYVGYRALSVDYSQGSGRNRFELDIVEHGPVIGVTTRF